MRAQAFPIPSALTTFSFPVKPDTVDPDQHEAVDSLVFPTVRQRLAVCFWFLGVAQWIYAVTLLLSEGSQTDPRIAMTAIRFTVLFACVWLLRGEGRPRQTLAVAALGIGTQLVLGVAVASLSRDVVPTALLTVVLACMAAVLVPWGPWIHGAVSVAAVLSIHTASVLVARAGDGNLGLDATATVVAALVTSICVAHFLDRARRTLEQRFELVRRSDKSFATLRDQLEKGVAERSAELRMANRELEGFSYTVSHDLRAPLRSIAGFSQVILEEKREGLDEATRGNLTRIHAAARRMDGVIDDMLLLSRIGRSAIRYEAVDLAAVARSIGEDLAAEYPDRDVDLSVEPVPAAPGDYALLRIAMDNLLRNAWKFTASREIAHVTVSGERVGDSIVCRVRDDGIGFDPRFRHKLFQPFERIHGDSCFAGSGIGLATVARIAHRHGGEVDAEGRLGQGASFSLILPVSRAPSRC